MSEKDPLTFDDEQEPDALDSEEVDTGDVDITPSDIVFECANCGHVIVIDYRGAGLMVRCPECGEAVEVPIPGGMNVSDLDKSPEELFGLVLQARRSLNKAEQRISELETTVASLVERRNTLESSRTAMLRRNNELSVAVQNLTRLLHEASAAAARMAAIITTEEQQ